MKEYFGKFETASQVQSAMDADELSNPYVALVGGELDYNTKKKNTGPTPSSPDKYLTFDILEGGYLHWVVPGDTSQSGGKTIEYSANGGEWTSITSERKTDAHPFYNANAGDVIRFRGNNSKYGGTMNSYGSFSGTSAKFKVSGNIMSLINGFSLPFPTTFEETTVFPSLFIDCTGLTDAGELLLPDETTAFCYRQMFTNCTSLTTAPELPATYLRDACYQYMFSGCASLNCIKCLAYSFGSISTSNWVSGVAASGTFIKNAGMTDWTTGIGGIPDGWTVVNAT